MPGPALALVGTVRVPRAALRAPVNVTWEVTSACNYACRHCLSAALGQDGSSDLDHEQCRSVVDELAEIGVFQVNFGGGEPFLRADFMDLLEYAQTRGITTCVSTNGSLVTYETARRLAAMPLLYLQVSLDGATAATNDAIRGAGSYERALDAVRLLAGQGLRGFSVNLVVTRLNFAELDAFCDLAESHGAKARLSRLRPAGAAREVWSDYRLRKDELTALSEFLGRRPDVLTGDSFFPLAPDSRAKLGLNICGAAGMTCAIAPDGGVYPCAFLNEPVFLAGNLLERPLLDIYRRSPVFERFRALEAAACADCERLSLCHGGCPAVAYYVTSAIDAPDPECLQAALQLEGVY
jgi:mycofactocin biosynthetic radical S-adenosylmethionine protein MftC